MKETLEESACIALGYEYDYWLKLHSKDQSSLVYIEVTTWCKGAKWQQERMYSEEEVIKAIGAARVFYKTDEDDGYDEFKHTPIEIIHSLKQFKK